MLSKLHRDPLRYRADRARSHGRRAIEHDRHRPQRYHSLRNCVIHCHAQRQRSTDHAATELRGKSRPNKYGKSAQYETAVAGEATVGIEHDVRRHVTEPASDMHMRHAVRRDYSRIVSAPCAERESAVRRWLRLLGGAPCAQQQHQKRQRGCLAVTVLHARPRHDGMSGDANSGVESAGGQCHAERTPTGDCKVVLSH